MIEYLLWFLLGAGVLFVLIALWFGITYRLTPYIAKPDGRAHITGKCGDTMEICLKFNGDRVVKSSHWTDGCAYSLNCVCAAAELARGRTPDEILEIDPELIQTSVGGLPKDQLHCAELSTETLYAALDDYMSKKGKDRPRISAPPEAGRAAGSSG